MNSSTTAPPVNGTQLIDTPLFIDNTPMIFVLTIANIAIFVMALVGNITVIMTVATTRSMHTVINIFICNLCVADILVTIFCLPITLLNNILTSWYYGIVACRSIAYLQGITVCASAYTLSVVALDRYFAVCHPMKQMMTFFRAKVIIAVIWIFSVTILSPWAIFYKLVSDEKSADDSHHYEVVKCIESWPDFNYQRLYFLLVISMLLYGLPLIFIVSCYSAVALKIWRRVSSNSNLSQNGGQEEAGSLNISGGIDRAKTIRVIKMLVMVVALFAFCWMPLFSLFNILYFHPNIQPDISYFIETYVIPFSQLLGTANSCSNPWVYCVFSKNYREGFKRILLRRHSKQRGYAVSRHTRGINNDGQENVTRSLMNKNHKTEVISMRRNIIVEQEDEKPIYTEVHKIIEKNTSL